MINISRLFYLLLLLYKLNTKKALRVKTVEYPLFRAINKYELKLDTKLGQYIDFAVSKEFTLARSFCC